MITLKKSLPRVSRKEDYIYRYKKVLRQGYIPVFTNRTVVTMASLRFTNTLQPTNYTIHHFYVCRYFQSFKLKYQCFT